MTVPLTHRELQWWIDLTSAAKPQWAALARKALVKPGRLRGWQLDAVELSAICAVLDDELTLRPELRAPLNEQLRELRDHVAPSGTIIGYSRSIAGQVGLHERTRERGGEHRCSVVSKGGACSWETHVMRVFALLPYEGWPPLTAAVDGLVVDIVKEDYPNARVHVRAYPPDVLALLAARVEWLEAASGPLAKRELPPTMYAHCPHCDYKWRVQARSGEAVRRCPQCRVSIEAGFIIGPCRHCGDSWRQRGSTAPLRCPRCNRVRPVEEVTA